MPFVFVILSDAVERCKMLPLGRLRARCVEGQVISISVDATPELGVAVEAKIGFDLAKGIAYSM